MAAIKNYRLSSDYLYTYTSKLDNIKLMLKYGLRHSMNQEKIPYQNSEQHNFIVCFCDILPEQSDYHKSVYGNYGLSFKKNWGIQNGISPVRYVHEKSTGTTSNYVKIKNDLREARKTLADGNQIDYFLALLLHSTAREKGLLTKNTIDEEIGNMPLVNHIKNIDSRYAEKLKKYGAKDLMEIFNEWVVPILHLLEKSVDELEKRDALIRLYEGDFRHIKSKILYDEREWRSVKFISETENKTDPTILENAVKNGYLPEKFNLKFGTNDIAVILVESDAEKQEIKDFILKEVEHLSGAEGLVFTFSEHVGMP
jgi:hypothetical protein